MSNLSRFSAYAAAFEEAYKSDDWAGVEPFFAEAAVFITGIDENRIVGREAILNYFKADLDGFDRRFDSRDLQIIEGPIEEGPIVRFRCCVTYRAASTPDLLLTLDQFVTFENAVISQLEDRYTDAMQQEVELYVEEHGEKLGFALD